MPLNPKVSIIGGGLSAIYAFWGCLDAGYDPDEVQVLYKDRGMSAGAVFMYEAPIEWPMTQVTSILLGTCDQYSINQWGEVRTTSVNKRFNEGKRTYITEYMIVPDDIMVTLWGMIPNKADCPILMQEDFDRLQANRTAVICCFSDGLAKKQRQEAGQLFTFPVHINKTSCNDAIVLYNGLSSVPWVRQTTMSGKIYTEYDKDAKDSDIMYYEHARGNHGGVITRVPDFLPTTPPISREERTQGNLLRVGRYAAYQAGYLSFVVRDEVADFLEHL